MPDRDLFQDLGHELAHRFVLFSLPSRLAHVPGHGIRGSILRLRTLGLPLVRPGEDLAIEGGREQGPALTRRDDAGALRGGVFRECLTDVLQRNAGLS